MGKTTGFIEISRKERDYESVPSRLKHYKEFIKPIKPNEISDQGARCMDCGIPYCHQGCPVNKEILKRGSLLVHHLKLFFFPQGQQGAFFQVEDAILFLYLLLLSMAEHQLLKPSVLYYPL